MWFCNVIFCSGYLLLFLSPLFFIACMIVCIVYSIFFVSCVCDRMYVVYGYQLFL